MNSVILGLVTGAEQCGFTISVGQPTDTSPPVFAVSDPPVVPVRTYTPWATLQNSGPGALSPPLPALAALQFISGPVGFGEFGLYPQSLYLKSDSGCTNGQFLIQSQFDTMTLSFTLSVNQGAPNPSPTYYYLWLPNGSTPNLLQQSTINPGQRLSLPITNTGLKLLGLGRK